VDDFNARDLFAGLAMCGMMAEGDWFGNVGHWKSKEIMTETYAKEAYDIAEAMLKEKEKRDGGESKVSN